MLQMRVTDQTIISQSIKSMQTHRCSIPEVQRIDIFEFEGSWDLLSESKPESLT